MIFRFHAIKSRCCLGIKFFFKPRNITPQSNHIPMLSSGRYSQQLTPISYFCVKRPNHNSTFDHILKDSKTNQRQKEDFQSAKKQSADKNDTQEGQTVINLNPNTNTTDNKKTELHTKIDTAFWRSIKYNLAAFSVSKLFLFNHIVTYYAVCPFSVISFITMGLYVAEASGEFMSVFLLSAAISTGYYVFLTNFTKAFNCENTFWNRRKYYSSIGWLKWPGIIGCLIMSSFYLSLFGYYVYCTWNGTFESDWLDKKIIINDELVNNAINWKKENPTPIPAEDLVDFGVDIDGDSIIIDETNPSWTNLSELDAKDIIGESKGRIAVCLYVMDTYDVDCDGVENETTDASE